MQQRESALADEQYNAALDFLYRFVNYERKMTEVYAPDKMDPERPARLLQAVGDPHRHFRSIHVAGTKGKGSVAAMCAASLRAAGLDVGLYTSPHLQDLRERIRILTPTAGKGYISRQEFAGLVDVLRPVVESITGLTWFELITAVAFMHFARQEVDVAVVEVGLGGRLDATNVLRPLVSTITSLSLDHTGLLGDTIAAIATEKGGIIKEGVPVVSAAQPPAALSVIESMAHQRNTAVTVVGRDWQYTGQKMAGADGSHSGQAVRVIKAPDGVLARPPVTFPLALSGAHQLENAVVSLATLEHVRPFFPSLTLKAVKEGLSTVSWPGRLQILNPQGPSPTILADGAHNADSAQKLARYLQDECTYGDLWLVLGITADKNVPGILGPLLPLAKGVVVTQANHPRATRIEKLKEAARELGYDVQAEPDIAAAMRVALANAAAGDLICVTGSLFVVGDLLNYWESLKSEVPGGWT